MVRRVLEFELRLKTVLRQVASLKRPDTNRVHFFRRFATARMKPLPSKAPLQRIDAGCNITFAEITMNIMDGIAL
jgi:hypothetical protein